jgi:hypothetical protein
LSKSGPKITAKSGYIIRQKYLPIIVTDRVELFRVSDTVSGCEAEEINDAKQV